MNEFLMIIPACNEEANISRVLSSLNQLKLPIDILVVDDGSSDRTVQIASTFPVFVLSHPTNLGYGCAIQTGYRFAARRGYPYVISFDADGQHDPAYVLHMMEAIQQEGTDVVIGSRFLMKGDMKVGWMKRLAFKFFRGLIYSATKKKITDPTSGFRAYKFSVYEPLANELNFPWDYPDSNFIIEIILNQNRVVEIPVNMYDRENGKSMQHSSLIKACVYTLQILLSVFVVILRYKLLRQEKRVYE